MNSFVTTTFDQLITRSWWVICFALLCGIAYEQGLKKIRNDTIKLKLQLKTLEKEYQAALDQNNYLKLQINSQSDPSWIEFSLMKGLGVVPEGQTKIYFDKQ